MLNPLVTVIIPVYNQEKFVIETVESVCTQTYSNLQIIVVDDGSHDKTADVVKKHFADHVDLIRQSNGGPSAAVNTGLRHANGELIALMGGDDICSPDRISHQVQFRSEKDHDIVFCRPKLIDGAGENLDDSTFPVFFRQIDDDPKSIFRSLFFEGNFLCAPSALITANAIQKLGYFHEGLIQLQDYDYWLRACGKGLTIGISDYLSIAYRRHSANLSSEDRNEAVLAEFPYILYRLLSLADSTALRAAFYDYLVPMANTSEPLSSFEICVLLLAHPLKGVRARGLEVATDLFEDATAHKQLKANGVDLYRMIFNAMNSV